MAKLVRVYDPDETERRINLILPDAVCPGLLEFMSELPYGNDTPLIRGVFYQWFIQHSEAGTLDDALNKVLSGPGGLISVGSKGARDPIGARPRKRIPKQRSVTAKGGSHKPSVGQSEQASASQTTLVQDPQPAQPLAQPAQELLRPAETDPRLSGATDQSVEVHAPSPPGVQPTDEHSLTVAQMNVGDGRSQMPDADQIALLNTMGTLFP
ncbi:hypothetical protein [Pseudomonas sp. 460]|uniref:hypothetical protein n=1 Tax=Pseudomonas sp. 460 TaxID=2485142 RepID=UPI001043CE0C|nr:hypothetical protein [Pseudomonas sp. 460]TCV51456.1 hypothetical protein EDB99_107122 [Pseudomonas sp. 460]